MLQSIIAFIIVFSVIVIVHEFGHYYFAKRSGILVREFAIGMGPKLFQVRKGETVYTLRMLPLGGYVRMAGLGEEELEIKPGMTVVVEFDQEEIITRLCFKKDHLLENGVPIQIKSADLQDKMQVTGYCINSEEQTTWSVSKTATIIEPNGTETVVAPIERQFQSASLKNRILTNFGGPLNNFLLAILTFTIVAFLRGGVEMNTPEIGSVMPDSPAQIAGIEVGDYITKVADTPVNTWMELATEISKHPNEAIELELERNGNNQEIKVTPQSTEVDGKEYGRIGIGIHMDQSFLAKIKYGFSQTYLLLVTFISFIGTFFTKGFSVNELGGPVAMYSITSQVVQTGLISVINFIGILSVNLGVMNLLPIPALDGGKLLLNFIELIRGKKIDPEKEGYVTLVGAVFLLLLMIVVTWNDISRLF
ncbi:site-2 protease. Metallo peptidase. MEROPS family M50B [Granulicatella balaenopterae]|uniref:Zinc metalloprotease n=1 Tax=Granulicatella balaenopterae TaxID=137733 RepID=A0A1H9L5R2_9LACT|nr:RIP metalloprotease RseP [Granulicatella balaenopterae]SER06579.1 site-2 protease. Metallo peptidase. MEROPS family M50B [Granulicatella balaenopterae]